MIQRGQHTYHERGRYCYGISTLLQHFLVTTNYLQREQKFIAITQKAGLHWIRSSSLYKGKKNRTQTSSLSLGSMGSLAEGVQSFIS